jgi:hypothetical protein
VEALGKPRAPATRSAPRTCGPPWLTWARRGPVGRSSSKGGRGKRHKTPICAAIGAHRPTSKGIRVAAIKVRSTPDSTRAGKRVRGACADRVRGPTIGRVPATPDRRRANPRPQR